MPKFDEIDQKILDVREVNWIKRKGPRVGDFIQRLDGKLERFSHNWGDGLQTCDGGSFYLHENGCAEMSGTLKPTIFNENIQDTKTYKEGSFWFFHHDCAKAHNGVSFLMNCKIYQEI